MHEIERKFLAAYENGFLGGIQEHMEVKQGYIVVRPWMEWRLRHVAFQWPRNYHVFNGWSMAFKFGNGFIRREFEWDIPYWLGGLLGRLVPKWLRKSRLHRDGYEVDVFHGDLQGVILAEYEVPDENSPAPPVPEGLILLRDVTEEGTFANKNLSRLSSEEARNLAAWNFPPPGEEGREYLGRVPGEGWKLVRHAPRTEREELEEAVRSLFTAHDPYESIREAA